MDKEFSPSEVSKIKTDQSVTGYTIGELLSSETRRDTSTEFHGWMEAEGSRW